MPPNICTPRYLADKAIELAQNYDSLGSHVVDEQQMEKLGMNPIWRFHKDHVMKPLCRSLNLKNNPDPDAKPIV